MAYSCCYTSPQENLSYTIRYDIYTVDLRALKADEMTVLV